MNTLAIRLVLSASLLAAGAVAWMAAGLSERLAARHELMATLQSVPAAASPERRGWRRWVAALVDHDAELQGGASRYWQAEYRSLTEPSRRDAGDPALLLVSANAAFRQAQREAGGRPISVDRLDQIVQTYAGVLRNAGFDRDAAYNYEYVARIREITARGKPSSPRGPRREPPAPPSPARLPGELPGGPTIHGRPGTHPQPGRGEEFEIITPMNYGEREAQPEPTPGVKLPKKG
jgi:hypothetical protein